MSSSQQTLLSNLLDGLDWLFDKKIDAYTFYVLLYATHHALDGDPANIEKTLKAFEALVHNDEPENFKWKQALDITNPLRLALCKLLDC